MYGLFDILILLLKSSQTIIYIYAKLYFVNILLPLRIFVIYLLLKEYWIFQQILYIGKVRRRLFYILYGSEKLR